MEQIIVSQRNEKNSSMLKAMYPDKITVEADPAVIAEKSDILFLCVRPEHAEEVLKQVGPVLRDDYDAVLINCIYNLSRTKAAKMAGIHTDVVIKGEGACVS